MYVPHVYHYSQFCGLFGWLSVMSCCTAVVLFTECCMLFCLSNIRTYVYTYYVYVFVMSVARFSCLCHTWVYFVYLISYWSYFVCVSSDPSCIARLCPTALSAWVVCLSIVSSKLFCLPHTGVIIFVCPFVSFLLFCLSHVCSCLSSCLD